MRGLISRRLQFITALVIVLVGSSTLPLSNAEFYSSMHKMSLLVEYEHFFLHNMEKYITDNENKIDYLKERLEEFERERDEALDEGATYFDSPVNKFLLTKRLTMDWERIANLMEQRAGQKYLNKLEAYKLSKTMPDTSELIGAIDGLLRIQEVYRLRTKDIADGLLDGVQYKTKLEARHCYDIGKRAIEDFKLKFAHSWFSEALVRFKEPEETLQLNDTSIKGSDIVYEYVEVQKKLGDLFGANQTYAEWITLQPENSKLARDYVQFMDSVPPPFPTVDLSDEHDPIPENLLATDQFARYRYTCSGHIKPSPTEERDLRCGYMSETHPFLLLAPLKVEELNHDPLLVIYHEVISDREIEIVKKLANQNIQRARVLSLNGSQVSNVRTSQFTFIPKTKHPVLEVIDERVEDMTNLNMDSAEDHQFANYGIGGHYGQHHDYFDKLYMDSKITVVSNREMGNRIATVLFYLSDVEQGGGTAFPYLKQLLMPKKGSAAFWYNLHASGNGDVRSLHGACPIIAGSKWVQNRWIREIGQQDRRPCDMFDDTVNVI